MANLIGRMLVAQSGGPTAVINGSLAGVIQEAGRYPDLFPQESDADDEPVPVVYGALNGILGVLNEDFIDLEVEKRATIEALKFTPGAALGTCRYKIDFQNKPEQAARDVDRLFKVFEAHNIRYFFYIGGNDSQDTAFKVHEESVKRGWEMRVIGIPKTIDNDLANTDHCPGYGSTIKYNAATVMEVAADIGSMATDDGACCLIEVMGRDTGWIAAGTVLAKRDPASAPHIILLPEVAFDEDRFVTKVKETISALKYCIVVVAEGIKDAAGNRIGLDTTQIDPFGHGLLSGAAERLAQIVSKKLNIKARTVKLGYAQRSAAHFASATDIEEAVACGEKAVRVAVEGKSGYMVKLERESNQPYRCTTALQELKDIANVERLVPREWISEDGFLPNEHFVEYAKPLIQGELPIPMQDGLPRHAVLDRVPIPKRLPPRES
ncbi:MAG: 6-phosphofructokinase [Verrucomicrobiota bacterium]|nr:6-phosphofructokinase [Verrucomicrobiota bacterium]